MSETEYNEHLQLQGNAMYSNDNLHCKSTCDFIFFLCFASDSSHGFGNFGGHG